MSASRIRGLYGKEQKGTPVAENAKDRQNITQRISEQATKCSFCGQDAMTDPKGFNLLTPDLRNLVCIHCIRKAMARSLLNDLRFVNWASGEQDILKMQISKALMGEAGSLRAKKEAIRISMQLAERAARLLKAQQNPNAHRPSPFLYYVRGKDLEVFSNLLSVALRQAGIPFVAATREEFKAGSADKALRKESLHDTLLSEHGVIFVKDGAVEPGTYSVICVAAHPTATCLDGFDPSELA